MRRTKSTFKVEGLELIPEETVLFVSNHEGNFDIPSLIAHIPKPFAFMSKVEVKKLPIIKDWMVAMNCVFIDRTNRRSSMRSITDMVSTLKAGHSMIIFPEGTRSKG
ncbi:MAG: lysophospholipid acyltransferase family protein, partial [Paenisporosarcina sp.]